MKKLKVNLIKNILRKEKAILAVYLFGSQAKGKTNKYSDIDIAIVFDEKTQEQDYADKQIELANKLSMVLGREIDIVILNRANLFLKYHILKEGLKIYERPDRVDHHFEARSIIEYLDFLPIKNRIENGMLAKIKEA